MGIVTRAIGTGTGSAGTGNVDTDGTTAVTSGSVATAFTSELTAPGTIEIAGVLYDIASITDDDNLIAVQTVPSGTNQSYNIGLRHYSTITLWEANLDSGIYAASDDAIGECYNDSVFSEGVLTLNGGSTVGLNSVKLTAASGEEHDGTAGTGVVVQPSGLVTDFIFAAWGFTALISLIDFDLNDNVDRAGIDCNTATADFLTFSRLLIRNSDMSFNSSMAIGKATNSSTYDILNCIIYDIGHSDADSNNLYGITGGNGTTLRLYNVTVHNIHRTNGTSGAQAIGIARFPDSGTVDAKNCIVTDVTNDLGGGVADCYGSTVTQSNNLSSDATATGTGSLINKTSANQFVSTTLGSENLHLKSGADAIDAGTDLGTTPSGVEIDIDGRDRDAQGDTWDMGADEFIGTGGTILPQIIASYYRVSA